MRRLKRDDVIMLVGVALLFVVVAESVLLVPWPSELHDIPTQNTTNASGQGVANTLFGGYAFAILLIGLLLAAGLIGGIYVAKEEGKK